MKTIIVIFCAFMLTSACSGGSVKPNSDSVAIRKYMDSNLNDIASYVPLSYEQIDSTSRYRVIKHRFRADNKLNATELASWCFRIGPDGKVIDASEETDYRLAKWLQDSINSANNY